MHAILFREDLYCLPDLLPGDICIILFDQEFSLDAYWGMSE